MKKFLLLLLMGGGGLVWAQTNWQMNSSTNLPANSPTNLQMNLPTNSLAQKPLAAPAEVGLGSDHLDFNWNTRTLVYSGNVWVTNAEGKLTCGQLTIDLPPNGNEHPTNIVAETNVVVDALDEKGRTNQITAGKAIYAYSVRDAVTNETITFTNNARFENDQIWQTGRSIIWDCQAKQVHIEGSLMTHIKQIHGAGGTNTSPFNFLK